jgi:predicted outer membrane protein
MHRLRDSGARRVVGSQATLRCAASELTAGDNAAGGIPPISAAGRYAFRAVVLGLVAALFALLGPAGAQPARAHQGESPAPSGADQAPAATDAQRNEPLTLADQDFLVKVRLAGLWETPAGQMAAQKGASQRVREVGSMIGSQHVQLDALVVTAAKQLGVQLPNEPNADQRRWLDEMAAASGEQFDHVFVDRLRAAHGKVFPLVANTRVGTRNSIVRQLAQSANAFVLTHLTLLESTNLVDYVSLPPPPDPAPAPALAGAVSLLRSPPWWAVAAVPLAGLLLAPRLVRRATRRRRSAGRRRPSTTRPPQPRRGGDDDRSMTTRRRSARGEQFPWFRTGQDRSWATPRSGSPDYIDFPALVSPGHAARSDHSGHSVDRGYPAGADYPERSASSAYSDRSTYSDYPDSLDYQIDPPTRRLRANPRVYS